MADIQEKILGKHGIDIAQENILKLYKLDRADLSPQELETKIQETRKRWETSINGANEKNAQRDRARLEKADKYESILRDAKLRNELFRYYDKSAGSGTAGAGSPAGSTESAKEYFKLVATTKNIRKADVDFYFQYYPAESRNKKAIIEMLSKDLKIKGLGKEESYVDDGKETTEEKKKGDNSSFVVNLFKEATILKIGKAVEKYESALNSEELCTRYPKLREGLYEFLEIKEIRDAKDFVALMSERGKEVYAVRQEKGTEYVVLVDLFNILKEVGEYKDVEDNIAEFKLLLKYPKLTPYMFAFVKMTQNTLKGLVAVAQREYAFRDNTDFLLNYYQQIYDNFGINNDKIASVIRKAQKKTVQNKVLNKIDEKLGRDKTKRKNPVGVQIIHLLVYWPIFVVYLIFEVAKIIFTKLHRLVIPGFIAFLVLFNWLIPKLFDIENILVLRKIVFKAQWVPFLDDFMGVVPVNGVETVVLSLMTVIVFLLVYIVPSIFAAQFVAEFADDFNKRYDWIGYERTFKNILQVLRQKTQEQYAAQKKIFIKNKIPKILMNVVCVAIIFAVVHLMPIAMGKLSDMTGYGKEIQEEAFAYSEAETIRESEVQEASSEPPMGELMVISADSANIRSGPGTEYDIVAGANSGDLFVATGRQETASNGRIWYEIYLDDSMIQTGWASQKVIAFQ